MPQLRAPFALLALALLAQPAGAQSTTPGVAAPEQPSAAAGNATTGNADWPCEQPLRAALSMGAVWSGPDPKALSEGWKQAPAVSALVGQIAPRHTPIADARAGIHRFAAGYEGRARSDALTQLFEGLFDTLSAERDDIIRGIKRFDRRQEALAQRIEDGWKALSDLDADATKAEVMEQRLALQQQVDWDSRVFDDRQRLLPAVCEQPRVLEQRLFALSRAIQDEMAASTPQ